MQLWESRPNIPDTVQSSPAPARDMEATVNTQESTAQIQQIHRWLDESTMEEIQESRQPHQWIGSPLLRTLNRNKIRHRQRQRRERQHRQSTPETTEELMAESHENTVKAVIQWFTWITEVEMHQTLRQQLEHPNQQYHSHLADTYTAQLQRNHGEVIEIDHDMLLDTEANMTAAGPNTMALDTDLLDKPEPVFTTQQDILIDTPIEEYHQQRDPPLPRSTRGTSSGYIRNYCEEEIHKCPDRYE